ncbi:unnamed protein product [Chondrus crispus]|uniref:Integrase catalytic domain-containing protein n=1 Tax=Chondrus crispus TaxID=2769 RepID=R7QNI8_CHOCR|nr:unnamed protein product [Chondrus crispus]CDF40057.1 unnamed protein product [Chondrus crispus]|eukprot:XP_005710351.1 unnamed protein product [Chondrus crispus]
MPFGLMNAPATFQRMLDILLSGYRWKSCFIYLDDIIIFSKDYDTHLKNVDRSQKRLPRTQTELRSFLGMCNVYRRFIDHFAKIAAPLTAMLRKGGPDVLPNLDKEQTTAFQTLKECLISPPVLKLPRLGRPYSLDTDASDAQLGCTLLQTHEDGHRYPVGYWSRTLSSAECNYSTTEKECLAIVWAVQTLRPYLERERFTVNSDHHSLRRLMNLADASGRLARWRLRLAEYDSDVTYVKGIKNCLADALSRIPSTGGTTVPIDEEIPCYSVMNFDDEPQHHEETYDPTDEVTSRLEKGEGFAELRRSRFFVNQERLVCRKAHLDGVEQIVVPTTLRERLLYLSHYPATSGHLGGRRLFYTLRQRFYWPSMSVDSYSTVRMCPDCAKARINLRKHNSELKTFPPSGPLEYIAIDILGELPRTPRGNRYLLVMTDRYSKLTRTVPLKRITAETVAQAFISHWVFVYGAPVKLLSDNGGQFTSRFFLAVCKILSIESGFTTAYHPQTNGQVERFNRTLVSTLRHYLADNQRDWDQYTDALTYGYYCTANRMIGMRPFDLVLSGTPSPLSLQQTPLLDPSASRVQVKMRYLAWLRSLISTASRNLLAGQERYKNDFDNRIRHLTPDYRVGDQVLVNCEAALRSKKKTDKDRVNNKPAQRTEGPFPVVQVDDHTVTILRGTGPKDWLSRDRVVTSPPLRSNVTDPPLGPGSSNGEDENLPDATPSEGTPATPALARPRPPGLMDAVIGGGTEDALTRLAGFRSRIGANRPETANHPLPPDSRPQTKDTRPVTRWQTAREPHEPTVDPTEPLAPRRDRASAPPATDPAHRAFISSGAAHLAARGTFRPDAFRVPLRVPPGQALPPDSSAGDPTDTYVVQSLTGHGPGDDGLPLFRVRWYGYSDAESTWEPARHIDYNTVARYCRRKQVPIPDRTLWGHPGSVGIGN